MPLNQTWKARLRLSVVDQSGNPLMPEVNKVYPGIQHLIGPGTVELQPGELYRQFQIPHPLKDYPDVSETYKNKISRSLLVLTTDTPGVYYSIGQQAPAAGALSTPRMLFDFSAEPFETATELAPVFDDETPRFRHYTGSGTAGRYRFQRVTDQIVKHGGYTGHIPFRSGMGNIGVSRLIWGRDNPQNLGSVDDSLVMCFWVRDRNPASGVWFTLLSYPFDSLTNPNDVAVAAGTTDDLGWLEDMRAGEVNIAGAAGRRYIMNPHADDEDRWRLFQVRKQDMEAFREGTAPADIDIDWTRITACEFSNPNIIDADSEFYFSPVFLMSEAQVMRRLDTIAVETILFGGLVDINDCYDRDYYERTGATLVLSAPPGHTARVQYFFGIV